jgi:hypothetical protein
VAHKGLSSKCGNGYTTRTEVTSVG